MFGKAKRYRGNMENNIGASLQKLKTRLNNAVNLDAFFVRCAYYKCAGYGWRYMRGPRMGRNKKNLMMFWGVLTILLTGIAQAESPTSPSHVTGKAKKLYSVIFGIVVEANGTVRSVRVTRVTDPMSGGVTPVDVPIPEVYVDAAKKFVLDKRYSPKLENGKPVEFYTYFFYDPANPQVLITEIK